MPKRAQKHPLSPGNLTVMPDGSLRWKVAITMGFIPDGIDSIVKVKGWEVNRFKTSSDTYVAYQLLAGAIRLLGKQEYITEY